MTCLIHRTDLTVCQICTLVYCPACREGSGKPHATDCIAWQGLKKGSLSDSRTSFERRVEGFGLRYDRPWIKDATGRRVIRVAKGQSAYGLAIARLERRREATEKSGE